MLTNHESLFQLQQIDLWLHDGKTIARVFNKQPSAILCSIKYGGDMMLFLKKYVYNVSSCMFMAAFRILDFIASFSR